VEEVEFLVNGLEPSDSPDSRAAAGPAKKPLPKKNVIESSEDEDEKEKDDDGGNTPMDEEHDNGDGPDNDGGNTPMDEEHDNGDGQDDDDDEPPEFAVPDPEDERQRQTFIDMVPESDDYTDILLPKLRELMMDAISHYFKDMKLPEGSKPPWMDGGRFQPGNGNLACLKDLLGYMLQYYSTIAIGLHVRTGPTPPPALFLFLSPSYAFAGISRYRRSCGHPRPRLSDRVEHGPLHTADRRLQYVVGQIEC